MVGPCVDAPLGAAVRETGMAPSCDKDFCRDEDFCRGEVGCDCAEPPLGSAPLTCPFCAGALAALLCDPIEPGDMSAAWGGLEATVAVGPCPEKGGPVVGGTPPVLLDAA